MRREMSLKTLAKKIGMPYSTMTQRFREPETIRLSELWKMMDALKVPAEDRARILQEVS
ncbi:MAG: helix-turn-helix domain-containing protein [Clostridiales bacterium]|nr:helix-turn-helix domain-containing protein [Clostridiales bacterium]